MEIYVQWSGSSQTEYGIYVFDSEDAKLEPEGCVMVEAICLAYSRKTHLPKYPMVCVFEFSHCEFFRGFSLRENIPVKEIVAIISSQQ